MFVKKDGGVLQIQELTPPIRFHRKTYLIQVLLSLGV
jgi:hypothetical protein